MAKTKTKTATRAPRKPVRRAQVTRPEPREADFSDYDWSTARKTVRQPMSDHIVRFTIEVDGEKVMHEELIDSLPNEAIDALGIEL